MQNPVREKSFQFSLKIIALCNEIMTRRKEYVLTKQLVKSATSVGANVEEAQQAQSRADFISKFSIAQKEGYETRYWIRLLHGSKYLDSSTSQLLQSDLDEILALLGSSIGTAKKNKVTQ